MTEEQETNDGSIKVIGTYTVKESTTEEPGMAFVLYSDNTVRWSFIAQLEGEEP